MKHNLQLQPKPKLEHKVMAESYAGPGQQNIMAHTATHGQVMATAKSLLCEEDIKQTASQKEGHHEAKRGASKQPRNNDICKCKYAMQANKPSKQAGAVQAGKLAGQQAGSRQASKQDGCQVPSRQTTSRKQPSSRSGGNLPKGCSSCSMSEAIISSI